MFVLKNDMTEVGRALGLEEKEINNRSTVLYRPGDAEFIIVQWSNRDPYLEITNESCGLLFTYLEDWIEGVYHEIARRRACWIKRWKIKRLERAIQTPERVLRQLQAACK